MDAGNIPCDVFLLDHGGIAASVLFPSVRSWCRGSLELAMSALRGAPYCIIHRKTEVVRRSRLFAHQPMVTFWVSNFIALALMWSAQDQANIYIATQTASLLRPNLHKAIGVVKSQSQEWGANTANNLPWLNESLFEVDTRVL